MQHCMWHWQAHKKHMESTHMDIYRYTSKKYQQACKHTHILGFLCMQKLFFCNAYTLTQTSYTYTLTCTHIYIKKLHNIIGKHVCIRWQRLCFAVAVSGNVWQHSSDTTLHGTVKLTSWGRRRRGWREEDNKVQTINWEVGKVWGTLNRALANSGITFTLNSSSTGSISTGDTLDSFLCLIFPFEKGGAVDTAEN